MTHRRRWFGLWGLFFLAGCAIDGAGNPGEPTNEKATPPESGFPPIDPNDKYMKPGPPLATSDEAELDARFEYHQKVIEAHGLSYTIEKSEPTHQELPSLVGFVQPPDLGPDKPKKAQVAYDLKVPEKWDSREQGVGMPAIRNQGSCGSCWAFGTVAVVEAAVAFADEQIVDLSEQFVLDCSNKGSCGGGYWAYNAFSNKGGAWEKDYPYKAYDQSCKAVPSHPYKIESYHSIQTGDIAAMKAAILQYGSVGVTMAVCGSIPGYGGGIYDSNECNYYYTNHIVTLVGWDDSVQHKSGKGAWILRNSWGTSWGDGGYGLFAYGKAKLEENPTYVIYKPEDPTDTDGDGATDLHDNCKTVVNPGQNDADHDGAGDACDTTFDPFEQKLTLTDDDAKKLALGFGFPFFGASHQEVYVNSDGNLTFGAGDSASAARDKNRFLTGAPRIAALYADLNPGAGGGVFWGKSAPDKAFVRFENVKRYDGGGSATVTVRLDASGKIQLDYGAVTGSGYIVGVSKGGASNAAGESALGPGSVPFGSSGAVYQAFAQSFGLGQASVTFTPGDGPTPPPPPSDTVLKLGDDDSAAIPIGFSFPFFGKTYTTVYANSDGNLSFGAGDSASANRDKSRFLSGAPRIAALYRDLDPSVGGSVSHSSKNGALTVRWDDVRHYGSSLSSSVSVVLHQDGVIDLTYGQVPQEAYIVGVSKGGSGNTGIEQTLSALGQPIGYKGTESVFQVFGKTMPFDLAGKTISISPNGGVDPPPPAPPTTYLTLSDDGTAAIPLGFDFPFFGKTYQTAWVNADGNLTFGKGDGVTANRDEKRFLTGQPRIALLYSDLDPSAGGSVSYRHDDPQSVSVRFAGVPVWGGGGSATAEVKLASTGLVTLSYESLTLPSAIVGVSKGGLGNATPAVSPSALLQSSWSYGSAGSVHAFYSSNDAFGLTSKSVTFSP